MTNPDDMTPEETVRFLAVEVMDFEIDPDPNRKEWCHTPEGDYDWNPLTDANDRDGLVDAMFNKRGVSIAVAVSLDHATRYHVDTMRREGVAEHSTRADDPGTAVCCAVVKAVMAEREKK